MSGVDDPLGLRRPDEGGPSRRAPRRLPGRTTAHLERPAVSKARAAGSRKRLLRGTTQPSSSKSLRRPARCIPGACRPERSPLIPELQQAITWASTHARAADAMAHSAANADAMRVLTSRGFLGAQKGHVGSRCHGSRRQPTLTTHARKSSRTKGATPLRPTFNPPVVGSSPTGPTAQLYGFG